MPREFDFGRYLRDYPTHTPAQHNAFVHQAIRAAQAERTAAIGRGLGALARWSWRTVSQAGTAIGRLTVSGWECYQRGRQRRLAAERLHTMDDRMLKDIGLNRGDIGFVLSGAEDPTRLPRGRRRVRDPLALLRPKPGKPPVQRAERPLVARNACAG